MRMEGFWPDNDDPADRPNSFGDPTIEMGWEDEDDDAWDADDRGPEEDEESYLEGDDESDLNDSDQDEDWD